MEGRISIFAHRHIKRMADFIVFRNVFIALAAVALVAQTRYLTTGAWFPIDGLLLFTFFSTFFVYNFHGFSNYLDGIYTPQSILKQLLNPARSFSMRWCVGVGMAGTAGTFFMLPQRTMLFLVPAALITLAYTLPLLRLPKKSLRLREIMYVKIFTVAFMWSVATVLLPVINDGLPLPLSYYVLLFTERFLFVYAITIPFEIRDRHKELAKGFRTIPGVYGIRKSKMLGYIVLLLYALTVYIREFAFTGFHGGSLCNFSAFMISALTAGLLIRNTGDNNNRWYYKFMLDGTMIEQFVLLILFSRLC